ncbi:MAG: ACP S-malonyltransferase, partial [Acidimicrobiales bacterium]
VVATTRFANTAIPVVANTDARAYTDGGGWASRLVAHLVQPVRWRQSMLTLADLGATSLIEVGPGTTLTGLAARAVPELDRRNCAVPADIPRPLEVH